MSKKTKDVIIIICISVISAAFYFFISYCEFTDYQAYQNGDLCECHSEFGFHYTEYFIKGLVSVISGIIMVFIRNVLKENMKIIPAVLIIVTILISVSLIFI